MKFHFAHSLKQQHLIVGLGLLAIDAAFFDLTNPDKVPSIFLIVGFLLVAINIYGLLRLVFGVAIVYGLPMRRRVHRIAMFLAVSSGVAVALQSLGELTLRDIVVLTLLSLLAYVYTTYGRTSKRN